jgi:hypothetical protein
LSLIVTFTAVTWKSSVALMRILSPIAPVADLPHYDVIAEHGRNVGLGWLSDFWHRMEIV